MIESGVEHVWSDWKTVRLLGEGSFGKVYEIVRKQYGIEEHRAVKVIGIPTAFSEVQALQSEGMSVKEVELYYGDLVKDFTNEIAMMSKLRGCVNIVGCEDYAVVERTDRFGWDIYIRMDLLTSLPAYIDAHKASDTAALMDEHEIIRMGIDICKALEVCAEHRIVHRDIKPDNIFVSEHGDFKLGDFGVARTIDRTVSGLSKKGTYVYMAPEIYKGEPGGLNADIYSLGIVLYKLLNGNREPFLPSHPTIVRFEDKNKALARRMNGEPLPPPNTDNRLLRAAVLKACAFHPMHRFATPTQMKNELIAALESKEQVTVAVPRPAPAPTPVSAPMVRPVIAPVAPPIMRPTAPAMPVMQPAAQPVMTPRPVAPPVQVPAQAPVQAPAAQPSATTSASKSNKTNLILLGIIGVAAIALIVVLLLIFGGSSKKEEALVGEWTTTVAVSDVVGVSGSYYEEYISEYVDMSEMTMAMTVDIDDDTITVKSDSSPLKEMMRSEMEAAGEEYSSTLIDIYLDMYLAEIGLDDNFMQTYSYEYDGDELIIDGEVCPYELDGEFLTVTIDGVQYDLVKE